MKVAVRALWEIASEHYSRGEQLNAFIELTAGVILRRAGGDWATLVGVAYADHKAACETRSRRGGVNFEIGK